MWKDEIVEEIHRYREEYAARFNYDIDAIFADIKQKEIESERRTVSFAKQTNPQKNLEQKAA